MLFFKVGYQLLLLDELVLVLIDGLCSQQLSELAIAIVEVRSLHLGYCCHFLCCRDALIVSPEPANKFLQRQRSSDAMMLSMQRHFSGQRNSVIDKQQR